MVSKSILMPASCKLEIQYNETVHTIKFTTVFIFTNRPPAKNVHLYLLFLS